MNLDDLYVMFAAKLNIFWKIMLCVVISALSEDGSQSSAL